MAEEEIKKDEQPSESSEASESSNQLMPVETVVLRTEAQKILHQLMTESDADKQKDLTYLFLQNQNKKTMARMTKMDELIDLLVDKTMDRFQNHADEVTTKELIDGLKTVSDLNAKSRAQLTDSSQVEAPLIQINQQNNEVNVGDNKKALPRASREKVKNLIVDVISALNTSVSENPAESEDADIIDATEETNND